MLWIPGREVGMRIQRVILLDRVVILELWRLMPVLFIERLVFDGSRIIRSISPSRVFLSCFDPLIEIEFYFVSSGLIPASNCHYEFPPCLPDISNPPPPFFPLMPSPPLSNFKSEHN